MSHYSLRRVPLHSLVRYAILGVIALLLLAFLIRTAATWL